MICRGVVVPSLARVSPRAGVTKGGWTDAVATSPGLGVPGPGLDVPAPGVAGIGAGVGRSRLITCPGRRGGSGILGGIGEGGRVPTPDGVLPGPVPVPPEPSTVTAMVGER